MKLSECCQKNSICNFLAINILKNNFNFFFKSTCEKRFLLYICTRNTEVKRSSFEKFAKIAQLVERNLAKVEVAGSNPVFRSISNARVVELVDTLDLKSSEHLVRAGSSPALSTKALNIV